jgi:hypothetical protein
MVNKDILKCLDLHHRTSRYLWALWQNLEQGHELFSIYNQLEYLSHRDELTAALDALPDDEWELLQTMADMARGVECRI